jgi:hypothetical protein
VSDSSGGRGCPPKFLYFCSTETFGFNEEEETVNKLARLINFVLGKKGRPGMAT